MDYPGYGLSPNPRGRMSIGIDSINALADAAFWSVVGFRLESVKYAQVPRG